MACPWGGQPNDRSAHARTVLTPLPRAGDPVPDRGTVIASSGSCVRRQSPRAGDAIACGPSNASSRGILPAKPSRSPSPSAPVRLGQRSRTPDGRNASPSSVQRQPCGSPIRRLVPAMERAASMRRRDCVSVMATPGAHWMSAAGSRCAFRQCARRTHRPCGKRGFGHEREPNSAGHRAAAACVGAGTGGRRGRAARVNASALNRVQPVATSTAGGSSF